MRAFIPPELLDIVPMPVFIVLEQATDVTRMEMTLMPASDSEPNKPRVMEKSISLEGSEFDTFLSLFKAGAKPSWRSREGGWSISFYAAPQHTQ